MDIKHKIVKLVGIRDLPIHGEVVKNILDETDQETEYGESYIEGPHMVNWIMRYADKINNLKDILLFLNQDDVLVRIQTEFGGYKS